MDSVNVLLSLSLPPKELSYEQKVILKATSKEIKRSLEEKKRKTNDFEQKPFKKKRTFDFDLLFLDVLSSTTNFETPFSELFLETKVFDAPPMTMESFDQVFLTQLKQQGDYDSIPVPPSEIPRVHKHRSGNDKPPQIMERFEKIDKPREVPKVKKSRPVDSRGNGGMAPLKIPPKGRFVPINVCKMIEGIAKKKIMDEKLKQQKLNQSKQFQPHQGSPRSFGGLQSPTQNHIQQSYQERRPQMHMTQPKSLTPTPLTYNSHSPTLATPMYRGPQSHRPTQYVAPTMMQPTLSTYPKPTYQPTPMFYSPYSVPFGVISTQYPPTRSPPMHTMYRQTYDPYPPPPPQYGLVRQYAPVALMGSPFMTPNHRK
jgi:hypothetical protein